MNRKADEQLPASEVSPRAALLLNNCMSDLPIMAACKVQGPIAGTMRDIEVLRVVEGDTPELMSAKFTSRAVLHHVDAHDSETAAADAALAAKIERRP